MIHFDRDADIVYVRLDEGDGTFRAEETPWGLIERDSSGKVVGVEIWRVSELPPP